jgi:hypothetical protein
MRAVAGFVVALSLAAAAVAQPAAPERNGKVVGEAAVAKVRALQAVQAGLPPAASFAEELQRRIDVEQAIRDFGWRAGLSVEEQRTAIQIVGPAMIEIDADNTAWLKTRLPADGWFKLSRDGPGVTKNAFLIVQHSPDAAWRKQIVARMEPLAKAGEAPPGDFALMYDRVMLKETGKQRYGSQVVCRGGALVMADMDEPEPEKVQARRNAIGFTQPLYDDYRKGFEGRPC